MYLKNSDGEIVKCRMCGKPLTDKMELEWSQFITELFCSPDCATTYYYDYMDSKPVNFKEAERLIKGE